MKAIRSPLNAFDKITDFLKRLVLDYDLTDDEANKLSKVTDEVNEVREKYVDKRLEHYELPQRIRKD